MLRITTTVAALMALAGCASTPDIREEKMTAIESHADKHVDMVERQQEYDEERAEQTADIKSELAEVDENRAVFLSEAEARLEKLAIRMDEAKAKAEVGNDATDPAFGEMVSDLQQQHEQVESEVHKLEGVSDEEWEQAETKVNEMLSTLESRVDDLLDVSESA